MGHGMTAPYTTRSYTTPQDVDEGSALPASVQESHGRPPSQTHAAAGPNQGSGSVPLEDVPPPPVDFFFFPFPDPAPKVSLNLPCFRVLPFCPSGFPVPSSVGFFCLVFLGLPLLGWVGSRNRLSRLVREPGGTGHARRCPSGFLGLGRG